MATQKKASQKLEITASIEWQVSVCKRLGLAQTTVSSIWRGRGRLKPSLESANFGENSKRLRPSSHKLEWQHNNQQSSTA